jgi:hypothetical protein
MNKIGEHYGIALYQAKNARNKVVLFDNEKFKAY